jgi:hypothetical protein
VYGPLAPDEEETLTVQLGYVTDIWHAEDLARVPGTRWLIASGLTGPGRPQGHLHLIDAEAKSGAPVAIGERRSDDYGEAPPDWSIFDPHGLDLRPGAGDVHTLFVVNHGGREAIEIFEVDAAGPTVTWIGAVVQDTNVWGNAVAALPDGGIVVTNYLDLSDKEAFEKVYTGRPTGNLKEWHAGTGWEDVPGTECSAPNGVNVSPDGRWLYMNSWSTKRFIRVSRGVADIQRDELPIGFLTDNVKWSEDGNSLLIAGQASEPATVFAAYDGQAIANFRVGVARIDPKTLEVEILVDDEYADFGTAASGVEVDGTLWISNARGDRIAYVVA